MEVAVAAVARVASADARCYLQPSMPALLLEDPAEPDENVARTLAAGLLRTSKSTQLVDFRVNALMN